MFLHLMKKKNSVLCRFVHFTGNREVTDSRLQNRACPLFCILQLLYSFYWCSFNLSALLHSGSLPGSAQTESEASHMGNDVFCHSKKKKKKLKIKVCGELLFSSFILTNDITVQLLVSVVAGGRVARPGNSPPQLPPL